jgi:hypothetical protein
LINLLEGRAKPIKRDLARTGTPGLNNFRPVIIVTGIGMADPAAATLAIGQKGA